MMSQLVVRPTGNAPPAVHIDPLRPTSAPMAPGASLLRLGSQDLIRFAGYADRSGFQVSSFFVADAYLTPLEDSEQRKTSTSMLGVMTEFGASELEAAMRDDYEGLYVVGVTVISPTSGLRIDVRRSGFVNTSVIEEAERLIDSAWRELRLS